MASVSFIFNGQKTIIQCSMEDKMKYIYDKFISKIGIKSNDIYCLYGADQLNLNLTFNEHANSIDKIRKEMNILVYETKKTNEIKKDISNIIFKEIICSKCFEACRISFKNYKIKLYECKNGHEINNILLDEFINSQNIDETKIKCCNCDNNKSITFKNKFYKCLTCKENLCPLCQPKHMNKHKIIDYIRKNYICSTHKDAFFSYCNDCKDNLCIQCEAKHTNHKIIYFKNILPNQEENLKEINEFRKKIDKLNAIIKNIIKKLNEVTENLEIYFKINFDMINNYEIEDKNYQILQNINEIKNNIKLNDLNEIINEDNISIQFQNILNIYYKMKDNSKFNIEEIMNNKNYEIKKDNIIKYKINKNETKIRIFGEDFVKYNKHKCNFICEDKKYELDEFYNLLNFKKNKDILEIELIGINNITDMSYMFSDCSSLISLPDISKWNTNNVTDMNSIFKNCLLLSYLPDISKWNTNNVTSISRMFCGCSSLLSLPDISKWNINNVTNMNSIFYGCSLLKYLPDISKWNTNNIIDMSFIFNSCNSLESLPDISKWNTDKVIDMSFMFSGCSLLNGLPDISNWNTSKVTDMHSMFCFCESLSNLPDISKWDTSNVTNMNSMFSYCTSLLSLPDISKWNINNVTNMDDIFKGCKLSLNIPLKFKKK